MYIKIMIINKHKSLVEISVNGFIFNMHVAHKFFGLTPKHDLAVKDKSSCRCGTGYWVASAIA
jgi:hypothetical protein